MKSVIQMRHKEKGTVDLVCKLRCLFTATDCLAVNPSSERLYMLQKDKL